MNKSQQQLKNRLEKDYNDYIKLLSKADKKTLINQSYEIATVLNFYEVLSYCFEELNNEFPIENSLIKILLNYDGNILLYFLYSWRGYTHPEEHSFWYEISVVIDIIIDSIKELKKRNYGKRK